MDEIPAKEVLTKSEEETIDLAKDFFKRRRYPFEPILLFGDLGSGKTVFVKGLAQAMGIENYAIKSPTYTFIREYTCNTGTLVHVDLYRLESLDNLLSEQIEEYMDRPKTLVAIEWADKMGENTPEKRTDICFQHIDDSKRKITIFG